MSNDGQNFENPVHPSDDTQPQTAVNPAGEVANAQSRRNFLRTAVVSGVAVATVATSAGVAAAAAQPNTGILKRLSSAIPFGSSGPENCSLCFEDTNFIQLSSFDVQNGNVSPGQFYLWFIAKNLPQGSYTMSITQNGGTFPSDPFAYPPGSGQYAQVFQMPTDSDTHDGCPTGLPKNATKTQSASTVAGAFPFVTTGSGNVDLWLAVHLAWVKQDDNYTETTYTFQGSLTGTATSDGHPVTCTPHEINVIGKPKNS